MSKSTVRKGVLIAGGAAVGLLLAGCGGWAADPGAPASQSPTNPSPSSVAEALPESTGVRSGECQVEDLSLSLDHGEGTAGTYYHALIFTNKGNRECTMQGFPGVSYVTGDDGHQVGPAAERNGDKLAPVTLAPGAKANVTVGFRDIDAFDTAVCQPTATRGLRVYPPHEYDSTFLPFEGRGCAGNDIPESQLTVTSVAPGDKPA